VDLDITAEIDHTNLDLIFLCFVLILLDDVAYLVFERRQFILRDSPIWFLKLNHATAFVLKKVVVVSQIADHLNTLRRRSLF